MHAIAFLSVLTQSVHSLCSAIDALITKSKCGLASYLAHGQLLIFTKSAKFRIHLGGDSRIALPCMY